MLVLTCMNLIMKKVLVSVRNLIEYSLKSGSIDLRYQSSIRAVEGTKIHQKLQKEFSINENYESEVSVKRNINYKDLEFQISGRVDGLYFQKDNNQYIVEEIKSTKLELDEIDEEYNLMHWGQVKLYGYLLCLEKEIQNIEVRLLYVNIDNKERKILTKNFYIAELEIFCMKLLKKYYDWAKVTNSWIDSRNKSIHELAFPYENYRIDQRKMMVGVFRSIEYEKNLIIEAPTGIGKTISTLFPSIKSLNSHNIDKIFYMTAKTITKTVAEETIECMLEQKLNLKYISLTAKEKICLNDKVLCNPVDCPYANGHFDRISEAIEDAYNEECEFKLETVQKYAQLHKVCPFEFQLDMALWVDVIIGDYNYIFDPKVFLKRFFEENENRYIFLVDEVHNLIDRSRNMYSFTIEKDMILDARKVIGKANKKPYKALSKINNYFLAMRNQMKELNITEKIQEHDCEELYYYFFNATKSLDQWLQENRKVKNYDLVIDFYFKCHDFLRLYEYFSDDYKIVTWRNKNNLIYKLFCLDTAEILNRIHNKSVSSILFSATLKPLAYYKKLLGLEEEDFNMILESPFKTENIEVYIDNTVSTSYRQRNNYYKIIADKIIDIIKNKNGHYIIFLPSFKYLETIKEYLLEFEDFIIDQKSHMKEHERLEYIDKFRDTDENELLIGLAVIGGIFSEGIDLKGNSLIGVIVVGVGLPKISYERNLLKSYYDEKYGFGFEYAYIYPGMNKVLQSGGRLIRTETDKGILVLMEDRFFRADYRRLLPKQWRHYKKL